MNTTLQNTPSNAQNSVPTIPPSATPQDTGLPALAVQQPPAALAPAERVARGRGFVNVQRFAGTGSASMIKAQLKAKDPSLSSKALTRAVNECLRGERDVRCQLAIAWVTGRFAEGDVPLHGEVSSNGSVLRMRTLPNVVAQAPAAPEPSTKEEIMKALEALQAKLATMTK